MSRLRQSVPSLGALVTFEVAARLGSFTRAASELGVSQAAVSRQIRVLEQGLGVDLFSRGPRGVELTPDGALLADTIGESFARVADAIAQIRAPRATTVLTIGATLAFSHFWLLPRLPALRATQPGFKLRVVSQDNAFDLRQGPADVVLRYGHPPFKDGRSLASLPESIVPVASPELVARLSASGSLAERLGDWPLIESEGPEASWLSWAQWLSRAKRRIARLDERLLHFNHYSDAIYAAINGEGVALGWRSILHRPLADGRLAAIGDVSVRPTERHHVVVPAGRALSDDVAAFTRWIEEVFAVGDD